MDAREAAEWAFRGWNLTPDERAMTVLMMEKGIAEAMAGKNPAYAAIDVERETEQKGVERPERLKAILSRATGLGSMVARLAAEGKTLEDLDRETTRCLPETRRAVDRRGFVSLTKGWELHAEEQAQEMARFLGIARLRTDGAGESMAMGAMLQECEAAERLLEREDSPRPKVWRGKEVGGPGVFMALGMEHVGAKEEDSKNKTWTALLREAGAKRSAERPEIGLGPKAKEIAERFGFSDVEGEGGAWTHETLREAERVLSEAARKMGIEDSEIGGGDGAVLRLSGKRMLEKNIGGQCQAVSRSLTLSTPLSTETLIHEWAHALDARLGSASKEKGRVFASEAGGLSEGVREALGATTGARESFDAAGRERERLGRLAAERIGMRAVGEEVWAGLSEENRRDFIDDAWSAAFDGIAATKTAEKSDSNEMERLATNALDWSATRMTEGLRVLAERGLGVDAAEEVSQGWTESLIRAEGEKGGRSREAFEAIGDITLKPMTKGVQGVINVARDYENKMNLYSRAMQQAESAYDTQPWEVFARGAQRFLTGEKTNYFLAQRDAAAGGSGEEARKSFVRGWEKMLDEAGVRRRAEGMEETKSSPSLMARLNVKIYKTVMDVAEKIERTGEAIEAAVGKIEGIAKMEGISGLAKRLAGRRTAIPVIEDGLAYESKGLNGPK